MDRTLVEFVGRLRREGLRVSTDEVVAAAKALATTGLGSQTWVREVLAATCVKRADDRAVFDAAFDSFFLARSFENALPGLQAFAQYAEVLRASLGHSALRGLGFLLASTQEQACRERNAYREVGEPPLALQKLHPEVFGRLWRRLGLQSLQQAIRAPQVTHPLDGEGYVEFIAALEQALAATRQRLSSRAAKNEDEYSRELSKALSETEQRSIDKAIRRLAERAQGRRAVRMKRIRHGAIDVQATLRKSVRWGGVPLELERHTPRTKSIQLVLVCDISDSVRQTSQLTLNFAQRLGTAIDNARIYVFADRLVEVTRQLRHDSADDLLRKMSNESARTSDYASVFKDLSQLQLSQRTVLTVLGDARTNYRDPRSNVFERIRRQMLRIIWLNPEPRVHWNVGDSAMWAYTAYCDQVHAVPNVPRLLQALDAMLRLSF